MSQRTTVIGPRTLFIWLLIAIVVIVIAILAVGGLVIYPQFQQQQAEQARQTEAEQHYQAGVSFQDLEDWVAAEAEFKQVIALDANYEDTQTRLAEVKARLREGAATATAAAIAEAEQAQAEAQANAQATAAAVSTATAEALEAHYQAGVSFQEMGDWQAAEEAYKQIMVSDADYKDVETRLAEVKAKLADSEATATAVAVAQVKQAQAEAHATATARTIATATAQARATAQVKATPTAQAQATAEALEAQYQRGLGYINLEQWIEAKAELEQVFAVDPDYKEVQDKLAQVNNRLSELALLTPTPTPMPPIPPTPTPTSVIAGIIPFSVSDNPEALNPVFGWQPGGSQANAYDLTMNPGALTLIAGSGTVQWENRDTAPLVAYPVEGNFEAQVKVVFSPVKDYQYAGIGIRSTQSHNSWLRIARSADSHVGGQSIYIIGDQQGRALRLSSSPYTDDTVWFKVERRGSLFTLSYSTNGNNWIALEKDFVFEMSVDTEIFLIVFSTPSDKGAVAQFYDFKVFPK